MNKKDVAIRYFRNGFNCAQAVAISFEESLDISETQLLRVAGGFGGGMARLQDTCGTVTGAYMVIGLKYGKYRNGDDEAKDRTYRLIREFDLEFRRLHGSVYCRDLLGCDLMTDEGRQYLKDNNLSERVCEKCIETSIATLIGLFEREDEPGRIGLRREDT